jgi:hypothetical protein
VVRFDPNLPQRIHVLHLPEILHVVGSAYLTPDGVGVGRTQNVTRIDIQSKISALIVGDRMLDCLPTGSADTVLDLVLRVVENYAAKALSFVLFRST